MGLAAALLLSGCGDDEAETPGTSAPATSGSSASAEAPATVDVELVTDGKLTVCTSLPYEPFESNQGGEVVGFDIDMMDLVAAKVGAEVEVFDTSFDGIQSGAALNAGQCDIAAAAMTITPERQKSIDFSDPYFDANQALYAKPDSGITSLESAQGKKLSSQTATTGEKYARDAGLDPVSFETPDVQLNALRSGQVDVIINDLPVISEFAKDDANADFELVATIETGEQYGFGLKKGNTALLDAVNEALSAAKSDGSYDASYTKWIGDVPTPAAS